MKKRRREGERERDKQQEFALTSKTSMKWRNSCIPFLKSRYSKKDE